MDKEPLLQKVRIQEDLESDKKTHVNGGEDDGPITFILLLTTLTALWGTFSYGTAAGFTSPAQTGMMEGLNLSLAEFSFFGSVLTIGGLVGAALSGRFADLFGRRGALWVSNSFSMAGWLMIAFSQGTLSVDIGRFLLGVASGVTSYVVPVYIVEIAPKRIRGAFSAVSMLVMCASMSFSFLVGSVISWQKLALINTVPCILEFAGLFFIPESPRWLSRNGRVKESEVALQRLRGNSTDITKEATEIKKYMENLQESKEDSFLELFKPRYSRAVVVGIGLLALQQLGGLSGYTFYMSSIFNKAGFPNNVGVTVITVVQATMSVFGLAIVDKFGRRPLLMVATGMMCLGSLITGLSFLFQSYALLENYTSISTLIGVLVFLTSGTIGIGGIPWVIVSEMTPMNIKGSSGTLCNITSWSTNWFVSYTFNFLFQWSSSGVFFIYSMISGMGIVFVMKMVPETRGRSLEEIQADITR
ncbi:putative sugar transporter ERD6-like 13 [Raphanus sativus]|uniref:Sugar transporter ERD6-like 13 n=1 Tax=Raphanus sativus TaxID=3726 RepID=A0A9W3DTZ7_RAPSA|nr:putative sugar transporter ERD6-like 13 [Raphanus sativus]KAJ4894132.1 putative sugar transporter ERD6-like 13 [Raphanus sativus]